MKQVWAVYRNSDIVEGNGPMVLDRVFAKKEDAIEYMNSKDDKDPFGNPYVIKCGGDLPAGASGIAVMSKGEDGKEGTSDDLKSWE